MPSIAADKRLANALVKVLGDCTWEAVGLARGYLARQAGSDLREASRLVAKSSALTITKSSALLNNVSEDGLRSAFTERTKTGSAENYITKSFPSVIAEERFVEQIEKLQTSRAGIEYSDERVTGHTLTDFRLTEHEVQLPINVKTATTRFLRAKQLVDLEPEDCVPIPAYKAHGALESQPDLLYVVVTDFDLLAKLETTLPNILTKEEGIVWELLSVYGGSHVRRAEDRFVFGIVKREWNRFREIVGDEQFHVISARKAIRVLQTKPHRTPGIGLRAWGTGATAEVNVHISVSQEMTPWGEVARRITEHGLMNIVDAVNRRRTEVVFDPEI